MEKVCFSRIRKFCFSFIFKISGRKFFVCMICNWLLFINHFPRRFSILMLLVFHGASALGWIDNFMDEQSIFSESFNFFYFVFFSLSLLEYCSFCFHDKLLSNTLLNLEDVIITCVRYEYLPWETIRITFRYFTELFSQLVKKSSFPAFYIWEKQTENFKR